MIVHLVLATVLECFLAVCKCGQVDFAKAEFGYVPERFLARHEYVDTEENRAAPKLEELEFEPVIPNLNDSFKITMLKDINCEEFPKYAFNCTVEAATMYNSSRKSPPMPSRIDDWCRAIKHLTNCAIDWNSDCKDVTDSHFHDESIRGHMHVVTNICENELFLMQYDALPDCIEHTSGVWEECYKLFKLMVEEQKNTTLEWTHYETHFYLCCARTRFRRCTLDLLFESPPICAYEQAVTLQKFSVIISEGDVFQDCENNMLYKNCPGGDPRPSAKTLLKLTNPVVVGKNNNGAPAAEHKCCFVCIVLFFVFLFIDIK